MYLGGNKRHAGHLLYMPASFAELLGGLPR
jgi:hypothetical protein